MLTADEAMALPMPVHHLGRDEGGRAEATCDAPQGSACRVGCAEECGAEMWPCGWDEETDERHRMHDVGYCNVVLYLNSADPDWLFSVEGDPQAHTYVGPITVTWQDETYVWEPAEATGPSGDSEPSR